MANIICCNDINNPYINKEKQELMNMLVKLQDRYKGLSKCLKLASGGRFIKSEIKKIEAALITKD